MMRRYLWVVGGLGLWVPGCTEGARVTAESGTLPAPGGADTDEPGPAIPGDGSTSGWSSSGAEGPPSGSGDEATTGLEAADCKRIDLLFVVETPLGNLNPDDAANEVYWDYYDKHARFVAGMEQLVSTLAIDIGTSDVQVMVTGSIQPGMMELCAGAPKSVNGECQVFLDTAKPDACDEVLGAGRNGYEAFGAAPCSSQRWFSFDQPDFDAAASCAFFDSSEELWGYSGPGEDQLMSSMVAALGPQSSGCNQGFVRNDAMLVVVLLALGTDALHDSSGGSVETWAQALINAKGSRDDVVVLAMGPDANMVGGLCAEPADPVIGAQTLQLTQQFEHSLWSSSCLPDYGPFFAMGAEVIGTACQGETAG